MVDTVYTITDSGRSYRILDPGEGRIGSFIRRGIPYEQKMLTAIRDLGLSGSVLDVGAHVGNHALYLAAVCGFDVWAFEPNHRSYRRLVQNVELNALTNVHPHRLALGANSEAMRWDREQEMTLRSATEDDPGVVPTVAFDHLEAPDDLVLVKIDVEGMEPAVLSGMVQALARSHPIIYAEAHTDQAVEDQRAVIQPLGYRLDHFVHMGSRSVCWREG